MTVTPEQRLALRRMITNADSTENRNVLGKQVAAFLASYGENVLTIADVIGTSETNAQELIAQAFNEGICIPLFKGDSREIQNAILGSDLGERLRGWLGAENPFRDVRVFFSSKQNPATPDSWDQAVIEFAKLAGQRVHELLEVSKTTALTWGRTVSSIVNRVVELGPIKDSKLEQVIPTWGEPLNQGENVSKIFTYPISCSSSALALQNSLGQKSDITSSLTLTGVPVIIPLTFRVREVRAVKKLLECSDSFVAVFGKGASGGMIKEVDTIITAVGAPKPKERFWSEAVFQSGQFKPKQRLLLESAVVGDIGGVWIHKTDVTREQKAFLEKISDHWLGIKLKHLSNCARNAITNGFPGVIACAVGASRAEVILEGLRAGLINELCIDNHLASKLLLLLETEH